MRSLALCTLLVLTACAGAPTAIRPGAAGVWGYVHLVPREGVPAAGGAYGDRRYADVERVDYSRAGFAVVYVEGAAPPAGELRLGLLEDERGLRFVPRDAALGAGARVVVENRGAVARLVSCPAAGVLARLAPGEAVRIPDPGPGALEVFALDGGGARARLFVAPGPFARVAPSGRYELLDLPPGLRRLHVWHPRFPSTTRSVELRAGAVARVDLDVGVDVDGEDGNPDVDDEETRP